MFLQDIDSKLVYDVDADADIELLVSRINAYLEKWGLLNQQKIIKLVIDREENYE